ncbi:MAG: 5-methyltetrahydrofolate--homocysteine methyltransferase [Clostridia bacterium]|jgi:5-methyltetrahydrofolate--homocysteine methyltransferase|nr:5-methyltetrahydrofolate--homocysteine methyltransferase [Clostridia bacterium]
MSITLQISESLQKGRLKDVKELINKALEEGIAADVILNEGLLAGMDIIGGKFKRNEVYVPEVLIAARAMNAGAEILKPKLVDMGVKAVGKVVLCTVKGDLHDIGKNLVKMMLEGKGLEVIDLGIDISAEKVVEAVKEHDPQIVALSALLTTTMGEQKVVIDALKEAGLRDQVKVMIGGAPVTQSYADEIGADAFTPDAATCAEVAKEFVVA